MIKQPAFASLLQRRTGGTAAGFEAKGRGNVVVGDVARMDGVSRACEGR